MRICRTMDEGCNGGLPLRVTTERYDEVIRQRDTTEGGGVGLRIIFVRGVID